MNLGRIYIGSTGKTGIASLAAKIYIKGGGQFNGTRRS